MLQVNGHDRLVSAGRFCGQARPENKDQASKIVKDFIEQASNFDKTMGKSILLYWILKITTYFLKNLDPSNSSIWQFLGCHRSFS